MSLYLTVFRNGTRLGYTTMVAHPPAVATATLAAGTLTNTPTAQTEVWHLQGDGTNTHTLTWTLSDGSTTITERWDKSRAEYITVTKGVTLSNLA
jgi:hypothetical protein